MDRSNRPNSRKAIASPFCLGYAELSEHQRSRDGSVFDGGGEAENLVQVGENLFRVHRPTNERGKGWIDAGFLDCEQASVADVPNSRRKSKSQELAERENVVSESGGIGVVLFDSQFRFMVEQTVQNVCRITYSRADELGVERPVLVRDVGVKRHAGIVTVACIYTAQCISGAAGSKPLAVRGTGGSVFPIPDEFQSVMKWSCIRFSWEERRGSSSVSVGSTRSQDGRWLECFLPRTRLITRADSNYSGGHEKR